jgi:hypothetical protein
MLHKIGLLLLPPLVTAYLAAETIIINPNPTVTATEITDKVTGADLTGLRVTATFAEYDGPLVFHMIWAATGPTSGSASIIDSFDNHHFTVVSLSLTGDASGSFAWNYRSSVLGPLMSLELDGRAAGIYFDRMHPGPGTPGSGAGNDIDIVFQGLLPPGIESNFIATYSNAVSLDGNSPENDLYARLLIDFPSVDGPFSFGPEDFKFTQATDLSVVPEPASSLLVASGLLMICVLLCLRRRRVRLQSAGLF